MLFEKHQSVYVLKYMNKYFKIASYANSPNDYLTDDVKEDKSKYTVRNGFGNTWEEEDFGFWIRW